MTKEEEKLLRIVGLTELNWQRRKSPGLAHCWIMDDWSTICLDTIDNSCTIDDLEIPRTIIGEAAVVAAISVLETQYQPPKADWVGKVLDQLIEEFEDEDSDYA